MCKNKAILRAVLICICVTLVVGCLSLGALAATNPVLQVNRVGSSASFEDGSIQVSLARDDVFTYNEILDLSAATKDVPLVDVEFDPTTVGTADATRVMIRLTDLYDESNYVTISLNNINVKEDWAQTTVYVTAGAADQPQVGVEHNPNGAVVHKDSEYGYGCAVRSSMVGMPESSDYALLTLYYDHDEKAVYVDRETYTVSKQLVVDLDNSEYFGEELWAGFTTGQVKMTVFATNYQADTCNFTISTIAGKSNFQDNGDQSAPVIFIDSGYAADQLPTALVGKPYPVFDAIAIDGCEGEVAYTVTVRDQTASKAVSVVDGKFTPANEGVYVITYTAKDSAGNTATKSVKVNATTGEGLQVTLQDVVSETDTGVAVKLFSGVSYTNASGHVSYSVAAKDPVTGEVLEIDPETLTLIPMNSGAWEITVTVKDHISTVVKTFTVTANPTTQPQVYDDVAVPKYFIKGASYTLPVLYAYDFSSGTGVATAMDVYVSETQITEQYTPSSAGNVTVTYRLTVNGNTCERSYSATVVDVESWLNNRVDMRQFFYDPTGAASEAGNSSSISYKASTDTTLEFLNLVQVKDLSFSFQVGSTNTYKKVNIYLTDPADSNKQVKLSYSRMADGKAAFCVNDGPLTLLSSNFDKNDFSLRFSADTCRVSPESGVTLKVKEFTDGSAFTGFTGSVARFSVQMAEVTGEAKVVMTELNSQGFHYNYGFDNDEVAPQLFYDVPGDQKLGAEVTIPGAFVHDVLNPVATATVTVTDPNGNVLLNNVDATKDYTFTASDCGEYTVSYTVEDGEGNEATHSYTISVSDGIGPEITLPEDYTVESGTTVTIATAQVSDNGTALCYVFGPEGDSVAVTDGTFVAATAGTYTVRYMAVDSDGNYGFASYAVTAEEDAESTTSYISQSVSLGSEVALNLWGNVPEAYRNSLSGVLAYDNTKQSFSLSQMTPAANGMYNIQAKLAMGQMTEKIDLTVRHPVFAESYYKSYSIRNYLTALLEGNFDDETKNLCKELMNLGAWAQKYFNYRTYDLVNAGYEITPANPITEASPTVSVNGNVDGVSLYGTTVVYLSKATVRFYFKAPGGVDGYTFTVDGTEYTPEYKSGLYYIETPGINPQNMSDKITVSVTDGNTTLTTEYAPIWYFIRSYNKSTDETTRGLMAAAYSYYKEAENYTVTPSSGSTQTPEAPSAEGTYICLDVLITTSNNSNEEIAIGFYPENFEGSINDCTDKVTVTAGTTTTVQLNAEKYMLAGNAIPNTLGVAVLGGPDGSTGSHTLKISNIRVEGELNRELGLNNVVVASGTNGTGFTDASGYGVASVTDDAIVIEGGVCNDGHKITLLGKTNTDILLDMQIDTLGGNWENDIEIRFYPSNFEGNPHEVYTDSVIFKAGEQQTVKLNLDKYLVNGELTGIGIGIFGGPEWNTQISDGVYDRHTVTISSVKLEGEQSTVYDLSQSTIASGTADTGYTTANGSGVGAFVDGVYQITGGFCYDCHKITLEEEPDTYLSLDMQIDTLGGNWENDIEIRFYPSNFEGNPHEVYTDSVIFKAGEQQTVKLNLDKYLVNGELTGIGIGIFGGPEWNTQISDGVYDRHTVTISSVKLEGEQSTVYDLSQSTIASGTADTGYTTANGSGVGAFVDGVYQITNGFAYDCHKITLAEETEPETTEPETTEPETTEPEATDPSTYISLDLRFETLGGSTDPVEIGFYPNNFEGDINNWTDKITITAGTTTTIKLDLDKYLVNGDLPGIGFVIFGGPAWDAKLPDGYTPDRHTVTISNVHLGGDQSKAFDLSKSTWTSAANAGYSNANSSGTATIGETIVITNGFQYDGHKITLVEDTSTYLCMDMLLTTLSNSTDPVNIRLYNYNYEGSVGDGYTDLVSVTAGTITKIKVNVDNYLVDGELPGFGVAIFGGPEWNTQISDGVYDRHNVVISNVRLEGVGAQSIDLNGATIATGTNGTGYTWANGGGAASIVDGELVITNGFMYDAHEITLFKDTSTYLCMDMLFTTLGNSTAPVEIGFYPNNFEGDINNWTDKITITAGTTANIKLDLNKYLVDGELPGIGFVIFGGPAWDAKLEDGYTPDRHSITISNARLEGYQSKVFDLSKSTWANGTNGTGYENANGSGAATIGESIVITNGFQYDGHKITLVEDSCTDICLDMLITTLGNSTDPIEVRFFPYNYTGSVGDAGTDQINITAGTATTVKLDLDKYLVDGELTGIGFAIMGGPAWDTKLSDGSTPDRHSVTISNARLEGVQAKVFDLSKSTWKKGEDAGYSWANSSGTATIGETIVITNGFQYDGHKITLVEDTNTYLCMDLLLTTLGNSTDPVEIRLFNYNYAASIGDGYTDQITVTAGTTAKIKVKVDEYLVDGELPGFGFAIMGGPTWDAKLPDGYTPDRHSITISNARLEGMEARSIDLSGATVATGTNGTGFTWANGNGQASIVDGKIVITDGFQYDAHEITF